VSKIVAFIVKKIDTIIVLNASFVNSILHMQKFRNKIETRTFKKAACVGSQGCREYHHAHGDKCMYKGHNH